MQLRTRLTLYFSTLVLALLALFSTLVYFRVRKNVLANAERALVAHLEHDAQHVGHSHDALHAKSGGPPGDNVYLRVFRDGVVVEDYLPRGITTAAHIEKRMKVTRHGDEYELVGYLDLTRSNAFLSMLRKVLGLACALALLIVIPFGLLLTRFLLAPFRTLAEQTTRLDAQHLSFRFPATGPKDEYGTLVGNINALLDKLEGSFIKMRRFASNASHELRTPLAVIIGQTEMVLRRPRTVEEHREVAEKILVQAKHLRNTTNRLLTLAHLERAEAEASKAEISVDASVRDVVETLAVAYRASEKRVLFEGVDRPLRLRGSEEIFRSIVGNLVENALKYSRTTVRVAVASENDVLRLRIEDDGPGLTGVGNPESPVESHGIGLSLVRACLDACRGEMRFGASPLGGLSVDILLPQRT